MVAVAILAILVAVSLPKFTDVVGGAEDRRIARLAQQVAITANNAVAAGSAEVANAGTVQEVMDLLVRGVRGSGPFADTQFRLSAIAPVERERAAAHLLLSGGNVVYSSKV